LLTAGEMARVRGEEKKLGRNSSFTAPPTSLELGTAARFGLARILSPGLVKTSLNIGCIESET